MTIHTAPPLPESPGHAAAEETLADLVERLGGIPLTRIRLHPPVGTAVERDLLGDGGNQKVLCELVDGVLVEKAMGYFESNLAAVLIGFLREHLKSTDAGIVLGEAGALRLLPGLVRIPDVSFLSWQRFPGRKLPRQPIPDLVPDLAVEILSEGNTAVEMERKLREYFTAGVRLVWYVQPETRTVRVYTSTTSSTPVGDNGTLDGGDVLPGLRISVREWFAAAGEREAR